jgi:hypothetical protein
MGQPQTAPRYAATPSAQTDKLVAAIFDTREKAEEGESALLGFIREGEFDVHSLARVFRGTFGGLEVDEAPGTGPRGERLRGLIEDLKAATATLPAPAFGLVTDLGSWGDLADFGCTPGFVQAVAHELGPDRAAVLAEIEENWVTPLDTRIEELGGRIIRTWCTDFDAERNHPPHSH